jgi:hypothetical protein
MTVRYQPQDLPPGVDEADLGLYSWPVALDMLPGATPQWMKETSQTDAGANAIQAMPNHFSVWALLGRDKIYLPLVVH